MVLPESHWKPERWYRLLFRVYWNSKCDMSCQVRLHSDYKQSPDREFLEGPDSNPSSILLCCIRNRWSQIYTFQHSHLFPKTELHLSSSLSKLEQGVFWNRCNTSVSPRIHHTSTVTMMSQELPTTNTQVKQEFDHQNQRICPKVLCDFFSLILF